MEMTSFLIIMALIAVSQIAILWLSLRKVNTVKAGNVFKSSPAVKWRVGCKPDKIQVNGSFVDVSDLEQLAVCGNSMCHYNIKDGMTVFVSRFSEAEKEAISTHPVVVLSIAGARSSQSKFKLRKMVSYADGYSQDWAAIYDRNKERIKIPKMDFASMCRDKVAKMKRDNINEERLVVSETYDENSCRYKYSLHPVSSLYAKVKYVL